MLIRVVYCSWPAETHWNWRKENRCNMQQLDFFLFQWIAALYFSNTFAGIFFHYKIWLPHLWIGDKLSLKRASPSLLYPGVQCATFTQLLLVRPLTCFLSPDHGCYRDLWPCIHFRGIWDLTIYFRLKHFMVRRMRSSLQVLESALARIFKSTITDIKVANCTVPSDVLATLIANL